MKKLSRFSLTLIFLLVCSVQAKATVYCSTVLDNSNTGAVAGEWTTSNGQNLTFTATKTAADKTLFQLASSTSTLTGLYEAVLQNNGGGATIDFGAGWTIVGGVLQKEVTWTTYPTGNIQIYLVARRNNSGGGSDIMGCQILNIDVSLSCPKPIYFINTPNWATPYAYLWNGGSNNTWPGVAMTNTGTTTTNGNYTVWSVEHGTYVNAIFSNNGDNQTQSGNQESFTEGQYFNYADNKWYSSENTLNINAGGWQTIDFEWINTSKTTVTAQIDLDAATTYEFYLHGTDYFKNNSTMTSSDCTNRKMNEANNCHITTEYSGTYIFNYDFATNHLSVTYPSHPQPIAVPANSETYAECQVLPILGTTKYTPTGVTGYETLGGGSGSVETIGGKNTVHIENSNYLCVRHADQDVSTYEYLHIDVWMAEANNIGLKLLCYNEGFKDGVVYNITTTAGGWKSLDIPLTAFGQGSYLQKAVGVYPVDLAGKDIWLANIYYYTTDDSCIPDFSAATACSGVSDEIVEGSDFVYGYDFSTLPNGDVQIQFEWKGIGTPANIYFHDFDNGNPAESVMVRTGKVGTKVISGLTEGQVITFACKFDKAGVYRTRRFVYKVGYDCSVPECSETGNLAAGKLTKSGFSRIYTGKNDQEQPQFAVDGKETTRFIAWGGRQCC